MAIINKGTSRNPLVMTALRELFWHSADFNFEIKAVHIAGCDNLLSDTISRLAQPGMMRLLYSLTNYLNVIACPASLFNFLLSLPQHNSQATLRILSQQVSAVHRWSVSWMQTSPFTEPTRSPQPLSARTGLPSFKILATRLMQLRLAAEKVLGTIRDMDNMLSKSLILSG